MTDSLQQTAPDSADSAASQSSSDIRSLVGKERSRLQDPMSIILIRLWSNL